MRATELTRALGATRMAVLTSALCVAVIAPGGGSASPRWRQGVFPVASFAGFTSHYGQRIGPSGRSEPHYGLDIAAPYGSPIHNWWGGRIDSLINDGSCGVGLVIRSGPYEHIYCHLAGSSDGFTYRSAGVRLQRGQVVRSGQVIGHVGMSGRTTGPHLHWGIRHRGAWLDPARVLRAMASSRTVSTPNVRRPPRVAQSR
jgi:murein DD-endopeptidase MepM/ murein hydrolase activator NlpD